jgi:ubiquinone/menaquinone biosynthesis C-methylase UbiE
MSGPQKFDFKNTETSVHKIYEELLVPRMFTPLAHLLLDHAKINEGDSILDIACGPGTVANVAAKRTGNKGRVMGLDISPAMLNVAKSKTPSDGSATIEYLESPAYPLQAEDDAFDVAVCQQGLQFFPEKVDALKEMLRITKTSGRIAVAVWGPIEKCELFFQLYSAMAESIPSEIAEILKAPFYLHKIEEVFELAKEAGFKNADVKTVSFPLVFEQGMEQASRVLEAAPFFPQIKALPQKDQDALEQSIRSRLEPFLKGDEIHVEMVSHILLNEE